MGYRFCSVIIKSVSSSLVVSPSVSTYVFTKRTMALSAVRLSWKIAAADIPDLVDGLIGRTKAVYDAVGALPHNQVNYENVVKVRD